MAAATTARFGSSDFYYLNGVEWNSSTGLPVQEDPLSYVSQKHSYDATVAAEAAGAFDTWFANNAGTIVTGVKIAAWFVPGVGPLAGLAINTFADGYARRTMARPSNRQHSAASPMPRE